MMNEEKLIRDPESLGIQNVDMEELQAHRLSKKIQKEKTRRIEILENRVSKLEKRLEELENGTTSK